VRDAGRVGWGMQAPRGKGRQATTQFDHPLGQRLP